MKPRTIAFFPEAAFGPALNSVGIAQAVEKLGHRVVFLSDPGFVEVYRARGFECHPVNLSEPMAPEEMARFWAEFINGHIPNFARSPYDQIDNYVKDCWEAIVDSAKWAEKDLPAVLTKVKPDMVCVDNVVLFPAIKRYAKENGKPWIRVISCSENEIEDPAIPPHLSGCGESDTACHARYRDRFNQVIKPIHDDLNAFLASCGEDAYPIGQFFETSPHMNLLLYPEPVKFARSEPLDPGRFQYLEGCVRTDDPYTVPQFKVHNDKPLLYVSYGSLGAGDTELLKRVIAAWRSWSCVFWSMSETTRRPMTACRTTCTSQAGFPSRRSSRRSTPSSITAATTPSPSASISASLRSSCPMSGTGTITPPGCRRPATASSLTATNGPTRNWAGR